MKVSLVVLLCVLGKAMAESHDDGHHEKDHAEDCTYGKLYVLDDSTSNVHVIDVSKGHLEDLTVETTVALPTVGAGELVYYGTSADPLLVQYRGQEELGYQDGFVRVINTGFSYEKECDHLHMEYDAPTVVQNALVDDCARPIHQVRHDDKIAIFCDGSFEHDPQVNTTVHVIDETKLGTSENAIVQSITLPGTHHGVAIPIDDGHLLHSIADEERVNGNPNVTSLPATFQVISMEGSVIHELADTSNPDTHCAGFHGSASVDNTHMLGCDDVHGGVLRIKYDPTSELYTSRALSYPDDAKYEGFRIGSFAYHKMQDHFVGSYALRGGTEFHLVAIAPDATAIEESNILTLPSDTRQCGFEFEVGTGEHFLVLMPNGVLHVFKVNNGAFTAVMEKEIVPGMTACSEATFVAGIRQVFVATPATKTLYAIDLADVDDGNVAIYQSTLAFTPTDMMVSGFSYKAACNGKAYEPPADCPTESPNSSGAGRMVSTTTTELLFSSIMLAWIFVW